MANVETIERPKRKQTEAPHVIRAMNAVKATLASEGIGKNRSNQQQGFKFRGIDDVLNALARVLSDELLVIVPHMTDRHLTERQTKNGGALFSVTITAHYTFVSAEDGSQFTVGPFYGEAMDSADKATNKAMSNAYKYMAIQTFCIPTEGDNDADATTHEVAPSAAGGAPHASPPPRQQQPTIRAAAQPFIDKAKGEIAAAEGDIDAALAAFDAIKARPGWKQLNTVEQQAIRAAMPDLPQ
jgi:hypothetical protein